VALAAPAPLPGLRLPALRAWCPGRRTGGGPLAAGPLRKVAKFSLVNLSRLLAG
jgi:hypothetical protein